MSLCVRNREHRQRLLYTAIALLALGATTAQAGSPAVSNVRAAQRTPTQLVDIFYDLTATSSAPVTVSVAISTNNGATYDLPASHLTGVGSVTLGTRRQIVWDAGADWPGQFSSAVRFKVTAHDGTLEGDYMVIDLSGGTNASSYPVSYLTSVPSGGWSDEYKTTKLVMRRIPKTAPGTFMMGSPTGELGREPWDPGSETQRQVTLTKDYYMGVFEVTQRQWERVMGDWPSYFNNTSYRDSRPLEQRSWNDIRGGTWPGGQPAAGTFMQRISGRTGLSFDLPTEAQWEHACRAGTTTALNSGKNLTNTENCPNMSEVGRYWYNGGSGYNTQGGSTAVGTAKAGSYLPNAWGLYDMHGNVWEWCLDWYETYHAATTDPVGAASGSSRVLRGGSWYFHAGYCRSAFRDYFYPDYRYYYIGFRLSRTLP